ncbi:MAG: type II toxin-antitoxin system Phd/YefM family antitoxin [Opitutales bacterium]
MKTIGVYELKTHLSEVLDKVEAGEDFSITRRGKPVARLVGEVRAGSPRALAAAEALIEFRKNRPKLSTAEVKSMVHEGHTY